ncbi:MAG TPA: hypothetical protein VG456_12785 [Candidatus Sulfopaludibacter sp.]|jgi:uncharacterized protein (TIGR03437 family)|nr:hypothetical protein [Candidatus Sulfopaludibacter sp.]
MKQKTIALTLALLGVTAAFPQVTLNTAPSRSVGTAVLNPESSNPNLVEGKELFNPEGIALDTSVNPPIVYVADTGNNRVLGWKNAISFNNGQAADLVIGQQDFFATDPQGPGHKFSVGLWAPTGLAVSSSGDLYIMDTDNNRVLRFRTPFQKVSSTPAVLTTAPDLVIGQASLTSRTANYTGAVSAQGLNLKTDYPAELTFDSSGNLWLCDNLNYRVLRFPSGSLNTTGGGIAADIVIGQPDMKTVQALLPNSLTGEQTLNQFYVLAGIGFDPQGRLYVGDSPPTTLPGRVLVFGSPSAAPNNASADRLMGVFPPNSTVTAAIASTTEFSNPAGIFFIPDGNGSAFVGVVDPNLNRATIFPQYSQWPAAPQPPSALTAGVIGQNLSFVNTAPNQITSGTVVVPGIPSASTLASPIAAAYLSSTKELFIADLNNNRVVVVPQQAGTSPVFGNATRLLGQLRFDQFSINYLEGKEFQFTSGAGIALDINGTVPHLYVADTANHRVLGFKDARRIAPGLHADLVIGQPDFGTALCNYPTGDTTKPTQSSLCAPYGLAVDAQGNLYVADSANSRVLRFPAPFNNSGSLEKADLVLGQQDFVSQVPDPTQSTMRTPYGVAISGTNGLLVSDITYNRVLYFKFSANGTFAAGSDNGRAATKVFGQQDFFGTGSGNSNTQLNSPHHIAADSSGRLYVSDTGNNRILIFHDPNSANTPTAGDVSPLALTQGLNKPLSVYVNQSTGEVWVANTSAGAVVRYPQYDTLVFNQTPLTTIADVAVDPGLTGLIQYAPLATVQDQFGDLFVADSGNRIITYYQSLTVVNGANFLSNTTRALAPNAIATIFPAKNGSATQFGGNTADFGGQVPVPTTVGDVQVSVNGTPSSIFYTSPGQINFVIPWNAPSSGTALVDVTQASTGQVLGSGLINMGSVSPGIFQCPFSVAILRQACIINDDGSINGIGAGALRGHLISIFGTGQGLVPNPPPDGTPASGAINSPITPRVLINGLFPEQYQPQAGDPADKSFVKYFGLAPGLLGLWQLNFQIPLGVVPGNNIPLIVDINDVFDTDAASGFHMSLVVK